MQGMVGRRFYIECNVEVQDVEQVLLLHLSEINAGKWGMEYDAFRRPSPIAMIPSYMTHFTSNMLKNQSFYIIRKALAVLTWLEYGGLPHKRCVCIHLYLWIL